MLAIDHLACQEAAIHGLGHRRENRPFQRRAVEVVIDQFLKDHPNIPDAFKGYALYCRLGKPML